MKNLIAITTFLALGIVSCSACAKQDQTPVEVPTPAPVTTPPVVTPPVTTTVVVSNENLQATLPSSDWKQLELESNIKAFINPKLKNIFLLTKEAVPFTYDQYVLMNLRAIKEAGGVVSSVKQQDISGHRFTLVDSTKNGAQILMWITLENGFGYTVGCGGPAEGNGQKDLCLGIGSTIKLN